MSEPPKTLRRLRYVKMGLTTSLGIVGGVHNERLSSLNLSATLMSTGHAYPCDHASSRRGPAIIEPRIWRSTALRALCGRFAKCVTCHMYLGTKIPSTENTAKGPSINLLA